MSTYWLQTGVPNESRSFVRSFVAWRMFKHIRGCVGGPRNSWSSPLIGTGRAGSRGRPRGRVRALLRNFIRIRFERTDKDTVSRLLSPTRGLAPFSPGSPLRTSFRSPFLVSTLCSLHNLIRSLVLLCGPISREILLTFSFVRRGSFLPPCSLAFERTPVKRNVSCV